MKISFENQYFRGSILYTPDNEVTRRIMKDFNKTLETYDEFRQYSQPFGGLFLHAKNADSYFNQSRTLTNLFFSTFFKEFSDFENEMIPEFRHPPILGGHDVK